MASYVNEEETFEQQEPEQEPKPELDPPPPWEKKTLKSPKPPCFCGYPCSIIKAKNGDHFYKCAVKVDYKNLGAQLKAAKDKDHKNHILMNTALGCKMYIKHSDYNHLHEVCFKLGPQNHPRCEEHNLLPKTCVSHSENNDNRSFFCCSAQYPDISCGHFKWCDTLGLSLIHI